MARPERNTVDYFPFYCDEGKKMFYIEETYGNDGFSVFVKLLRELAKTDYHFLDLSKKTTLMFLAAKCKVTKETLLAIISDLSDLEKFDTNLWNENKIIWCQSFIDSIQDAYKKRNNKCITLEGLGILLDSLGILKHSKCTTDSPLKPQRKEKKTKVEETKVDTWRDNFGIYLKELSEKHLELIKDQDWLSLQEKYNPNVDIILSVEKAINNFWGTEAGWKHKKKSKSKTIDWKSTLTNAIGINKVWKQKNNNETIKGDITKSSEPDDGGWNIHRS